MASILRELAYQRTPRMTHTRLKRMAIGLWLVWISFFLPMGLPPSFIIASMCYGGDNQVLLDPNRAETFQLRTLPGITETLAERIIDRRERTGPFTRRDELQEVLPISVYAEVKDLVEIQRKQIQTIHTDSHEGTVSPWQPILFIIFILALLGGAALAFHEAEVENLGTKWPWSLTRLSIWSGLGIACLLWAQNADLPSSPTVNTSQKAKETVLIENVPIVNFFTTNQVTLLALIVALAAYTSSVEQLLRMRVREKKIAADRKSRYRVDLKYMYRTDIILILAGAAMTWRMLHSAFGKYDVNFDRFNIGLIAWIILYCCVNLIRVAILGVLEKPNGSDTDNTSVQ